MTVVRTVGPCIRWLGASIVVLLTSLLWLTPSWLTRVMRVPPRDLNRYVALSIRLEELQIETRRVEMQLELLRRKLPRTVIVIQPYDGHTWRP